MTESHPFTGLFHRLKPVIIGIALICIRWVDFKIVLQAETEH